MSYSGKSRDAEAFDTFRRELMRRAVPVSKALRKEWEEKFKAFVEAALPEQKKMFQKPGLASRLFAAEIELVDAHERDLEAYSQHIDLLWEADLSKDCKTAKSLTSADRRNFVWEFALEIEGGYVTGCIKLRTTSFDRPEGPDAARPVGDGGYRRDGDRPSGGGYRGDRPSGGGGHRGDRPSGGGYRGDRPSGGGGYRQGGGGSGGGRGFGRPGGSGGDRPGGYGRRPKDWGVVGGSSSGRQVVVWLSQNPSFEYFRHPAQLRFLLMTLLRRKG